jgi:uncharacterized protein YegJ (DUF2314 family)
MSLLSRIFGNEKVKERKDQPDILFMPDNDEEMNWAIEKAGLTLWYFEQSLKNPLPDQQYFSVKIKITDGAATEHIWLNEPDFDPDGNLFGIVGNQPDHISTVKSGDHIGIERHLISDWMIIENKKLIGGYTIRAMRDHIPDEELQAFDDSIGVYIDEGVDYFKPDFDTPEGAILSLEQAFSEKNLDKALFCNDFRAEAGLVLAERNIESDQDTIDHTAEILEESFVQYLEENGMPDFSHVKRAFTHREKVNENHWIITEICIFPNGFRSPGKLDTFRSALGWKVVRPFSSSFIS